MGDRRVFDRSIENTPTKTDPTFGSEQAFSLVELLIVTLTLLIFTIAAVVQINRTIEHYDLTRLTSELIGKIETVRSECVKQSDGYPAAALLINSTTSPNRYAIQFYYRTSGIGQPVHTDYTYDAPRNYQFQVTPGTLIYTFNPRGKALAYGSDVYDTATAPLANLPVITIQNSRNPNLRRTITLTIAGNISAGP